MNVNLQEIINKLQTAKGELQKQQRFARFATGLDELISHTSKPLMLMVMGSFSTGKSSFINALVGEEIAAVEAKPTTAVVTKLCYGQQDKLLLHFRDGKVQSATPQEFTRMTAVNDEEKLNEVHEKLDYVERQMPLEILKQISIIDSPGLNDVKEKRSEATERFVSKADTVLWMFSVVQLATREEMAAMDRLTPRLKPIAVVNKMDLLDEEEDDPQEFLAKARQTLNGRVQSVVGISAKYELEGKKENNALKREIGNFAELEKAVADLVLPHREKFKLNTLLDELGVYFAAFNREFAKAKEENEAHKSGNYAVYMQNEERFMQVEDILANVISGIQDYCEREAGRNNEQALFLLGVLYDAGIGVLQDTEKALKFYQKAALKKHQGAMLNMYNYYNDNGADETAEYWLQKLAEQGLPEAQHKYIDLLRVQEKYEEYFIWCEKLAGQGDVGAQYKLAECLSKGIGCALNELKAINLYRQIVGRWNKEAQLIIAENMYNENNLLKRVSVTEIYEISINEQANYTINKLINGAGGDTSCKKEAYFWYKKLAEQGYIAAEKRLAECLYDGIVCAKNLEEALKWCQKAYKQGLKSVAPVIEKIKAELQVAEYREKVEKGDVQAQYLLAQCLEKGTGCQKNIDDAFMWYEKAAEGGLAEAQNIWGEYLYKKAMCAEAVNFYRKAAQQGHKYAARNLAECFEKGAGCKKNLQEALCWYKKAYAQGVKVKQHIEVIEKALEKQALFNKYTEDAKKGVVSAQYALAECLYNGDGCAVDRVQALAWYEKIVRNWSAEDQYILANNFYYINAKYALKKVVDVYRQAINMDKNYTINADMEFACNKERNWKGRSVGEYWYKTAAEGGFAEAQNKYAEILQKRNEKEEAFKWYKKAAEQSLARAQGNLAECYINGVGVTADLELAKKWCEKAVEKHDFVAQYFMAVYFVKNQSDKYWWYRQSADQGYAKSQNMVGRYLEEGWGAVEKSEEEAVEWFRKAAENGYAVAQNNLGNCLYSGRGCTRNYQEAVKWYRKAAEQSHAQAQTNLADCLDEGIGCAADKAEAFQWYKKAAEQNIANAQNMVGRYLEEGWGGVTKNKIEAVEWYRKAAENGYDLAQYNLAVFLENGIGCAKDEKKALKWFKKAAEQGHAKAQYRLADKLYYGKGCQQNKEEALNWYKKAAAKGNADAQKILDILPVNTSKAVQNESSSDKIINLRKAADQGDVDAQYKLAQCLEYGRGCDEDAEEALKRYRKAAKQGYEAAKIDIGRRVWSKSKNNDLGGIMAVAETGNEYAQYIVAEKLYYGKDCDGDKIEALKWYTLAAKRGNKDAQKKLAALMLWCLLFIVVAIGVLFKLLAL